MYLARVCVLLLVLSGCSTDFFTIDPVNNDSPDANSSPLGSDEVLVRFRNFADTEAVNVEFYSATGPLATLPDDLFVEENLVTVDIGVAGTGILEPFDTDSLLLPCGSELIIGTTGGTFSDNGSGEVRGTGDARWIQASAVGFCGREVVFDYIGVADGFLTQLTVGP